METDKREGWLKVQKWVPDRVECKSCWTKFRHSLKDIHGHLFIASAYYVVCPTCKANVPIDSSTIPPFYKVQIQKETRS